MMMVLLTAVHCGGGSNGENVAEKRAVEDLSPPEPPSIDADREDLLRHGTDLEKLLVKYELLVDRVRLERQNDVYNATVALDKGLIPIADDHHDLLERGLIDTTLHLEISMLAVYVLANHLNTDNDPSAADFKRRMGKIQALIEEQ